MKKEIRGLTKQELSEEISALGEKPYRAKQIYSWLHIKHVDSFSQMTDISVSLRDKLNTDYTIGGLSIAKKQISDDRDTEKYLLRLSDGETIECVWMHHDFGDSLCISSQVGCRMGCSFCASTISGLVRNLTASEMISQVYDVENDHYPDGSGRISNIIVMGMGEPFDNYDNLIKFIGIITDKDGRNFSSRGITVSTCGLEDGIRKLSESGYPVTLALSLHAADENLRGRLMPIAKSHPLDEVVRACEEYFSKTGRRISFEYSMISGVNDTPEAADCLVRLCHRLRDEGCPVHINLIPLNSVKERDYARSEADSINRFKLILEKNRINVTIRREMGGGIDAACGQLRRSSQI